MVAGRYKERRKQRYDDKKQTNVRNHHDKTSDLYEPGPSIRFTKKSVFRVQQDK